MLYWFFVKGLGPIAIHRLGPTAKGLEHIPHEGGAIIAANHLAVIDDALLPLTSPRMIHLLRGQRHQGPVQEVVVHLRRRVPGGSFRRFQVARRVESCP